MNKQKKVEYKKTLVRNTQKPVPKCQLVVAESQISSKSGTKVKVTPEEATDQTVKKPSETNVEQLDSPELYSSLKLSKKIDDIVKPRKTKSCSDVDKKKLAAEEKVSRKVNFPYDQPIYRDLIPLTCDRVQSQPVLTSRGPLPQKDKEPVLSDFAKSKKISQYYYLPSIKTENRLPIVTSNNLRLYKVLQMQTQQ